MRLLRTSHIQEFCIDQPPRGGCCDTHSLQSGLDEIAASFLAWYMQVCVGTRVARVQERHSGGERTEEMRCVEVVVVGTKNVVVSKKG